MKHPILVLLITFMLAGCVTARPSAQTAPPANTQPAPSTTPFPYPTPARETLRPAPSSTPAAEPTISATLIAPFVQGASIGPYNWSPDSRWLPYVDFKAQTLHFYDITRSTTCDFPVPIHNPNPYRFLAWLPDGQVVIQTTGKVMTGLPCGTFIPATAAELRMLDHQDPSFSPDGRYQVTVQPYQGSRQDVNAMIVLKDVASGKRLVETAFMDLPRGGGNLSGYWLDANHFLIPATGDQGPLLLTPGKPAIKIATDLFHLPLKPGNGNQDVWVARSAETANPSRFHIMLVGKASQTVENPLQIYHSETGQVETLPYLAAQGSFSNDGHWLLVRQTTGPTLIRPIDPPGSPFQNFSEQADNTYRWSPDGSKIIALSNLADQQSVISLYTLPQRIFLTAWQSPMYELYPYWSPDGKYLAVTARLRKDPNQEAIFVIQMPSAKVHP